MYNVLDAETGVQGFISIEEILEFVSEGDIFELVFGFKPKEYDYVTSPFREDNNAGCWFQHSPDGKLRFIDFGSQIYKRGQKMVSIDCFDAVKQYFNLPNMYQTLRFIKKNLINGKNLEKTQAVGLSKKLKSKVEILFTPRDYNLLDKGFWFDRYEIFKENLIEDKVYPLQNYKVLNSRFGNYFNSARNLTYCYTDFESGNKKIYKPYESKNKKFISTCKANDVGGLRFLPKTGKSLVITKSYKDYRVLKNQGLTVVWFQNEGMFPSLDLLLPICKRFKNVSVFFDNDKVGIESAKKLIEIINSYIPHKSEHIYIPVNMLSYGIKDPSDMIHHTSRKHLLQFLIEKKLL